MKNLYYVHVDTESKNGPQIHLKFFIPATKSTYSETLSISSESEDHFKITDITNDDFCQTEKVDDLPITTAFNGKITSLDLLNVVIPFTVADALCDTAFHGPHLAEHVEAFGAKGKSIVLAFKEKFLGPQKLLKTPAYKLADPFVVDLNQMKVTLGFECLIEKYLGKGTDYVYVNDKLLVDKIDVVRYSGKYTD